MPARKTKIAAHTVTAAIVPVGMTPGEDNASDCDWVGWGLVNVKGGAVVVEGRAVGRGVGTRVDVATLGCNGQSRPA